MSTQLQVKQGGFALQPQNINEAMQMAGMLSGSGMVPQQYKDKPEDTLVAMMMGAELGLNPIQALQNIAVINGRPAIWGDAMLALVQNHPAFGGITETFENETMTATCTVWRKGGDKHTVTFSKDDAVTANLWGKKGPWQQYPKRMLKLRARGFALRDQFADALSGLISAEEAQDMPADVNHAPIQVEVIEKEPVNFDAELEHIEKIVNKIETVQELAGYFEELRPELVAKAKPIFTKRKNEIKGDADAA